MTTAQTTLIVQFVSESAGYQNAFGWYNKVTGVGGVLFADVEAEGSHRTVTPGVSQVEFTVNTADLGNIEYFLIPDGGGIDGNSDSELSRPIKVIQLGDGTWAVATLSSNGTVQTGSNGKPNLLAGEGANAFFTEKAKNEGSVDHASSAVGSNQTAATLAGDQADGALGLVAWEDLAATKRANGTWTAPGDADYNDAVFRVSIKNGNPSAGNDNVTTGEDAGATTINVLANDTDPNGDAIKVTATSGTSGVLGTISIAPGGTGIVFNPGDAYQYLGAGETRTETFTYKIDDGHGGTDTATVTLKIVGANDAPVVVGTAALAGSVTERTDGASNENTGTLSTSGGISFTDVDRNDGHIVSVTAQGSGYRGTLTAVISDGGDCDPPGEVTWSYSVAASALDNLSAGQTLTQLYTVTISDGEGGTVSRTVTVTLVGTNDKPVITGAVAAGTVTELTDGSAGENTATHTSTGNIAFADVDLADAHTITVTPVGSGYRGALTASVTDASTGDGSGAVTWVYAVNDAALDDLAAGQTLTQSYKVKIDDGHGGTVEQTVTITIKGAADVLNNAPVITSGPQSGAATEIADNASGENATTHSQSGTVTFSDANPSDTHTASVVPQDSGAGYRGSLTLGAVNQSGDSVGWTFSVADATLDDLQAGQVLVQKYDVTLNDGHSGAATTTITVTLTGANDAPVITSSAQSGSTAEIADHAADENATTHSAGGAVTFADADTLDVHSASFAPQMGGYLGSFSLGAVNQAGDSVGWSFSVADSALDGLAAGKTLTQLYAVTVSDGHGGTATQTVAITLTGTNDAAILSSDTRNLTESDTAAAISTSGALTISDVDSPATFVAQAATAGTYGSFSIDAAGAWTYTASSAHDEFAAGTTYTDTFNVASADGTLTSVTVNILGTNDAAVLSSDVRNLTETGTAAAISTSGTLTISDVDSPAAFEAQAGTAGSYGTFAINTAGAWSYTADSAHDEFVAGTTYIDTFSVASADGTATSVTVNILGTNDGPVTTPVTLAPVAEDSGARQITQAELLANASDADGPGLSAIDLSIAAGSGTLVDNGNGTWSYTPAADDDTGVSFDYAVTDGVAAPVAATATLDITPVNDAPVNHYAASIVSAGADIDGTEGAWRTTSAGKPLDADGDNVYGTAGYFVVYSGDHAGIAAELPSFVSIIDPLNQVFPFGDLTSPQYQLLELPNGSGSEFSGLFYGTDPTSSVLSFTLGADAHFRLGLIVDNNDLAVVTPATITLTRTVGESASVTETVPSNDLLTDYYFFDVAGHAGDSFMVTVTNRPGVPSSVGIGGLTFDAMSADPLTASEDTNLSIKGLSVSDVDAGSVSITTTLAVAHGTLTVDSAGGAAVDGSGTGMVTLTGTVEQINTTLASADNVVYRGEQDFNGSAALTITTNDHGATGIDPGLTGGPSDEQDVDTITITVNPVNDAAIITGAASGSVTEANSVNAGGTPIATGDLNSVDVDNPNDAWQAVATPAASAGGYGSYTVGADGVWTYTLNNSNPAVDALGDGQSLSDSFLVQTADGTAQTVSITINGATDNLAPVVTAPVTLGQIAEDSGARLITQAELLANASDVDSPSLSAVNLQIASGSGTLVSNGGGTWSYTLALNDHSDVSFSYQVTDGLLSVAGMASLDITPVNDAAVLSSDTRNLTETDAPLATSGTLTISDIDSPATFVAQTNTAGSYGTFAINAAGAWTYTASSAHNEFTARTTYTDTFNVASADGTLTSVTVNILGTNDAAVLSSANSVLFEANTAAAISTSGTLTISDVDSPAAFVAQTATVGSYGTFAINAAGAWSYAGNSAHDEFVFGANYTDTFSVSSADGTLASVRVVIPGTNDAAVLSSDVRNLTETGTAAAISTSGTLTISDVDSPAAFEAQAGTAGSYGTFAINTAGAWSYTASSAHDEFAPGTTYTDTFSVLAADGTATSVTIRILGANQAAIITGTSSGRVPVIEGGTSVVTGDLDAADADNAGDAWQVISTPVATAHGSYTIDVSGHWSYVLNDADMAVEELDAGQTLPDSFVVHTVDGTEQVVSITIAANQAPVANPDTNAFDAVVVIGAGSIPIPNLSLPSAASGAGGFAIAGASISGLGDVNGDGLGDLLIAGVGAYYRQYSTAVVFGNADGVFNLADTATKFFVEDTGSYVIYHFSNYFAGRPVAGAGDVNGDGYGDLLIGGAGAPFVMFGGAEGEYMFPGASPFVFPGFTIIGETADSDHHNIRITSASGAGDVNGDGHADLLVTAEWIYDGYPWSGLPDGGAYVVFGKADNTAVHLDDIALGIGGFKIVGEELGDGDGVSISGFGDINGDGFADLLVGMPDKDGQNDRYPQAYFFSGGAYVVLGKDDGATVNLHDITTPGNTGGFKVVGAGITSGRIGASVSGVGDVNGDGIGDMLIGGRQEGRHIAAAYVVFSGVGRFGIFENFEDGNPDVYHSVSGAGDVNGDGLDDLMVWVPGRSAAYVVFGKTDLTDVYLTDVALGIGGFKINGDTAIGSVSGLGDINGDGRPDMLVHQAGGDYVVFGPPNATPMGGDPSAAGNVLSNDTDVDTGDSMSVQGVMAGTTDEVLTGDVGTAVTGTYGSLNLAADGSYVYTLDNDNPNTQALAQGEAASDVFTYTMRDAAGVTSTATLAIAIANNAVIGSDLGNDVLVAGAGNQTFTGRGGDDTFVFRDFSGPSTVTDFQQGHDVIEFDHAAFADFAAVLDHAAQSGADTVITVADHGTVTLQNVAVTNLHASDFHLV